MAWDQVEYREDELRACPVILIVDTSRSSESSIEKLNAELEMLMRKFDELDRFENCIRVTVIDAGENARTIGKIHSEPAEFLQNFMSLTVKGDRNFRAAFVETKRISKDRNITPKRWHKPILILIADEISDEERTTFEQLPAVEKLEFQNLDAALAEFEIISRVIERLCKPKFVSPKNVSGMRRATTTRKRTRAIKNSAAEDYDDDWN